MEYVRIYTVIAAHYSLVWGSLRLAPTTLGYSSLGCCCLLGLQQLVQCAEGFAQECFIS